MKRLHITVITLVFLTSVWAATAVAAGIQEIELVDGSVISGEVLSLSNGVYTVRSGSLGTLRIKASRIRAIRMEGAAQHDSGDRINSLQNEMGSDAEIVATIRALGNDPDFQEVLKDPEIMQAVQAGDIAALMSNPKFMKLLDKQGVRDINKKLAH